MTTKLTPELHECIENEADLLATNSDKPDGYRFGLEAGYIVAAEIYALKWQQAEQRAAGSAVREGAEENCQSIVCGRLYRR